MSQTEVHGNGAATVSTPQMMRAGVYRGSQRVIAEDVSVPEIGPGEILIRVAACGICGTDVKKVKQGLVEPPQILGHEIAGTIVQIGAGVERWSIGDRVISFHHIPCTACFYCERGLYSQCPQYKRVGVTAGFQPNGGGFAQYVRVMPWIVERGVVRIPDGVPLEAATFVEPVNTCLKAIQKARIVRGEVVVVIGQGPIGLLLTFLAVHAGATVFTTDPIAFRRDMSIRFGAAESWDPLTTDAAMEVRKRRENIGADAVLLAAPDPKLVPAALNIGIEEREILGSYSASVDWQEESARLVFENHAMLRQLITHRFPLSEVDGAFEMATHPAENSLKVVVLP
jgi:L-iditol 2-dehydrogenase